MDGAKIVGFIDGGGYINAKIKTYCYRYET